MKGHKKKEDNRPIGVFDSGLGGLTVLREMWRVLPDESTVYFGDSSRTPYGTKSHETIVKYALQSMRFLLSQDVKIIVIACNSASAHAFSVLRQASRVPVFEVVTPGAIVATNTTKNGQIGVIATRATVDSNLYAEAIRQAAPDRDFCVEQVACPLFVSLAEEGLWEHKMTVLATEHYLRPLRDKKMDTLILGCTHYPLLANTIGRYMGKTTTLVDAGASVAEVVLHHLIADGCAATPGNRPVHRFFSSDDPKLFDQHARLFLGGKSLTGTQKIQIEDYEEQVCVEIF